MYTNRLPSGGHHSARGFTLIELMVTIAIIGVLAAIAVPRLNIFMLEGRLEEAKPYLSAIAAKERIRFTQRGNYCVGNDGVGTVNTGCNYPATDERNLIEGLGVSLRDAANFCFVVRTSNFISSTVPAPLFEVWAVLRDTTYVGTSDADTVTISQPGAGASTCITSGKNAGTGWVKSDGGVGSEGRVVVLRYPPPANGLDTAERVGRAGINLDWVSGISVTDALL